MKMSFITVEEVRKSLQKLGYTDFSVIAVLLVIYLGFGFYFYHRRRKENNEQHEVKDYFYGGHTMKVFPVSFSLVLNGGWVLLEYPSEVYTYGYHCIFAIFGIIMYGIAMHFLVLPVFHKLKLTSIYEYLELRFKDRKISKFASMGYLMCTFCAQLYMISVLTPILGRVTENLNTTLIVVIVYLVCTCYSSFGGLKALIWADTFQLLILFGILMILVVKGTWDVGGLGVVLDRNIKSSRIEAPIFNVDPTIRYSVWSSMVGSVFTFLHLHGIQQTSMQRFVSLPTLHDARTAIWIFVSCTIFVTGIAVYCGLLLYATYYDCDPLTTRLVNELDFLTLHFVMETFGQHSFLNGIFFAALIGIYLGTAAGQLNSMAAVVFEDFLRLKYENQQRTVGVALRMTTTILGLVILVVALVDDSYVKLIIGFISMLSVTTIYICLGVFIIGLTMPWIGNKATITATILAFLIQAYFAFNTVMDMFSGRVTYKTKPLEARDCPYVFLGTRYVSREESPKEFYHISELYETFFGVLVTVVLANLLCVVFGRNDNVERALLSPPLRKKQTFEDNLTVTREAYQMMTVSEQLLNCE